MPLNGFVLGGRFRESVEVLEAALPILVVKVVNALDLEARYTETGSLEVRQLGFVVVVVVVVVDVKFCEPHGVTARQTRTS